MLDVNMHMAFVGLKSKVQVTHPGEVTYVSGRPVHGAPATRFIFGVVQNSRPEDLLVLPEGDRNVTAIKIHTQDVISPGEFVQYQQATWKVYNVADRQIGVYYKALCIREDI